ncbi:16S rRNA (adenine1518-N6/adenine1519-N6)-dimethyltransferase [Nakamurella sp. UYEF19]
MTLLGAIEIRRLAAELDLRPTKTLGQNFVHDANTVRRIASAAKLDPSGHVLEIGPGLGSLTLALLETSATVTAVEIDPRLAGLLPVTVAAHAPSRTADLTVITADAMALSGADIPGSPSALVANLPYNISVPVLLHLLAELPSLRRVMVMVQAEVADRLAAPPGSRTYGSPSAKAAWYGTAKRAGAVARSVFWPVPGVDSALVALDRHDTPRVGDRKAVFAVIDAAFAQRRKTLRAALSGWAGSPVRAEELLRAADVDPGLRGEMLDIDAFARIADARHAADQADQQPDQADQQPDQGGQQPDQADQQPDQADQQPDAADQPDQART